MHAAPSSSKFPSGFFSAGSHSELNTGRSRSSVPGRGPGVQVPGVDLVGEYWNSSS